MVASGAYILLWLVAFTSLTASALYSGDDLNTFVGYYEFQSDPRNDKYDAFLKAMEFDDGRRQMMKQYPMDVEIKVDSGNKMTMIFITKLTRNTVTFVLGLEQSEYYPNGQKYKMVVTRDGPNRLKMYRQFKNFNATTIVTFEANGAKAEHFVKDVNVTVMYAKRQQNSQNSLNSN